MLVNTAIKHLTFIAWSIFIFIWHSSRSTLVDNPPPHRWCRGGTGRASRCGSVGWTWTFWCSAAKPDICTWQPDPPRLRSAFPSTTPKYIYIRRWAAQTMASLCSLAMFCLFMKWKAFLNSQLMSHQSSTRVFVSGDNCYMVHKTLYLVSMTRIVKYSTYSQFSIFLEDRPYLSCGCFFWCLFARSKTVWLVTGTHQYVAFEHEGKLFVNPGSITGAFSFLNRLWDYSSYPLLKTFALLCCLVKWFYKVDETPHTFSSQARRLIWQCGAVFVCEGSLLCNSSKITLKLPRFSLGGGEFSCVPFWVKSMASAIHDFLEYIFLTHFTCHSSCHITHFKKAKNWFLQAVHVKYLISDVIPNVVSPLVSSLQAGLSSWGFCWAV